MFVQPLDEQAIRLGSEITFLRQFIEQLQKEHADVQKELADAKEKLKKLEEDKTATELEDELKKELKE